METVFPELVNTDQEGYKSVDYARLSAVLIEAIKEQQTLIEDQQQQIQQLKTAQQGILERLNTLEAAIGQ